MMVEIRWCKCAEAYYRDHEDGTRDFTIKGDSRCPMCHGSGYVAQCEDCAGTGVVQNAKCSACGGCGVRSKPAPATPPTFGRRRRSIGNRMWGGGLE